MTIPGPEISVVIPCFNEEQNAAAIAAAVTTVLEKTGASFDIIFIDNASSDNTSAIVKDLCKADARIRLIVNARNFGQMRSPTHAIFQAKGRAVIGICADFQDPPELLEGFVDRWRAGADIVLGIRRSERTSRRLKWTRNLSYAFARRFADYPIIPNATGFGLYDQRVVQAIAKLKEPEPFFRGMLVETGYKIETIEYSRPDRSQGASSNNFFTLLDFLLSSLAGFSKRLVRIPFFIGIIVAFVSGISAVGAFVAAMLGRSYVPWLIGAGIEMQLALLFIFMGLIGDQIRLISERTRDTPLVFERERVNFPEGY